MLSLWVEQTKALHLQHFIAVLLRFEDPHLPHLPLAATDDCTSTADDEVDAVASLELPLTPWLLITASAFTDWTKSVCNLVFKLRRLTCQFTNSSVRCFMKSFLSSLACLLWFWCRQSMSFLQYVPPSSTLSCCIGLLWPLDALWIEVRVSASGWK